MSYKSSQLSPLSTGDANFRISIQGPWTSPPPDDKEVEFFRSRLIYDPELDEPHRTKRGLVLGMALVFCISGSFWAGVGLAIAHVWK
jgi:hypothetical protein